MKRIKDFFRSLPRRLLTWRATGIAVVVLGTTFAASASFDRQVARAFEAAELASPTRVYARPLVVREGERTSADRVRDQLDRAGYTRTTRTPAIGQYRVRDREWTIGRRPLRIGAFFDEGGRTTVRLDRSERVRSIETSDGARLRGVVLDPAEIATFRGPTGRDRVPVTIDEVPDHLIDAILTTEDRRFLDHSGLDPRRILGALVANVREGRLAQGGSTVTQQLARTLFLDRDRKIMRKIREAAIAFSLERTFPKERLLSAYLNHIYLGQDGAAAIHGVGRAARFFFDKDVTELMVGESAMIAGIIRGPSVYSPHRYPERAKTRRDLVLRLMHEAGEIDADIYEQAIGADLSIVPPRRDASDARWFFDHLDDELAAAGVHSSGTGMTVVSTLEPGLQEAAGSAVSKELARLERMYPRLTRFEGRLQAALVAIDPASGEVLAMIGGRSYSESQFNRATEARRQPGSSFKPIVALAALARDADRDYTLASVLDDEPLSLDTPQGVWRPGNSDREFHGEMSLRQALAESRNVPFARLGLDIGPERIVETARRLGIESPLAPYPALALGASEVSLLELTSAYAVLAAGGQRTEPHTVRSALGRAGQRVDGVGEVVTRRAFSEGEAFLITSALRSVVDEGTGVAVRHLGYEGAVAAKSGTTNASRDGWFVGYTPELAVGVWVGFDDGSPLGLTGSQAALPIFTAFLIDALGQEGGEDFTIPDDVEWRQLRERNGRGWRCDGEAEVFLAGTAPRGSCYGWGGSWDRRRNGRDLDVEQLIRQAERWLRSNNDARSEPSRRDRRRRVGRSR